MSNHEELKEGDVVQLKSGGVSMTISRINGLFTTCYWADGKEISSKEIPLAALKRKSSTARM